jgi:hypothetical protein
MGNGPTVAQNNAAETKNPEGFLLLYGLLALRQIFLDQRLDKSQIS